MTTSKAKAGQWKPVAVAAAAATLVASVGATMTDLGPWYRSLHEPAWKPPDILFGPAWTIIFGLCAWSAATGWRDVREPHNRQWLVSLFCLNGILNLAWSALFFQVKRPDWALREVLPFWLSILALVIFLARKSRPATLMLVPYLLWVAFAAVLNWAVVDLNPDL